ncbi:MAG: AtzE family amidohydrolase [Pseudomonadota bacterium]
MIDRSDPCAPHASAIDIAAAVGAGGTSARAVAEAALARIDAADRGHEGAINAFTDITAERALAEAAETDDAVAAGRAPGPLAGVPYAVKNLLDIAGLPTRAGSRINRERRPASADALLLQRLRAAGAVLLGGLNMGEYAYDFTGENAHDGACRNPHDTTRMTGGSSSGSGAAVAAGFVPLSLGSDTNGSLRVPASLCGVFSLKPTYGRLPRSGSFPFVDSLDHLGPFARSTADLARVYDALQGPDPADHAAAPRAAEPTQHALGAGVAGLRIGVVGGWFEHEACETARAAAARVAEVLAQEAETHAVTLDGAEAARAAAYLVTNAESASFHLDRLRTRPDDFDPDTRDRFLAGAMLPASWLVRAQRVRRWWLERLMAVFAKVDLLLAPATPVPAPAIGQKTLSIGGREVPLRPSLGLLAQPFSAVGLPVLTVPVFDPGSLPIGVQLIAAPWREDRCLAAGAFLEARGAVAAHPPPNLAAPPLGAQGR